MTKDPTKQPPPAGDRPRRFHLGSRDLRPLPWRAVLAVLAGAVLLGIAAAVAARGLPERASEGGPAPIDLTDPRIGEFLAWVVIVLAAGIVIFTFWPTGNRPLRPRRPPVSLGRFLMGVAIVTVVLLAMRPILPDEAAEPEPEQEEEAVVEEAAGDGDGRPGWTLVLLAGALGAALGGIAVLGRRSLRHEEKDSFLLEQFPDIRSSTEADDERTATSWGIDIDVTEPRRARVVNNYGEMLHDFASSGHGRRASEAPDEYVRRIEASTAAAGSARRLTRLFEIAGFSRQPATDEMVADADAALDAVRRDLGTEDR